MSTTSLVVRGAALAVVTLAAGAVPLPTPARASPQHYTDPMTEWTTVKHKRRGFMIAYPTTVFKPQDGIANDDGRAFLSPDGRARLLVGTFENSADFTLNGYRDYLIANSYAGAKVDYKRTADKWFVISGTRGDTMFYERVTFTCGGKLVNSWAMLYPVAERRRYDRVVEAVARSYHAGSGATGRCD